jgi:hypothetical protein
VREPELVEVMAILDRYRDEPIAPVSALRADPEEVRNLLGHASSRHPVDQEAFDEWYAAFLRALAQHRQTPPSPGFEEESRKAWRAHRSSAERALVDREKFVPDADASVVRRFLEARAGRAAPIGTVERDRARSVLQEVGRKRRRARRGLIAKHHDNMLWRFLDWDHPMLSFLSFLGMFLISWTLSLAIAMGVVSPPDFVFPGHSWAAWIALFTVGWLISAIVPLLVANEETAAFVLVPALLFFPAIVAFIEVGLLRLLGWF